MRMKGSEGGEIVQVHGGHIIRSTGRKDRHSKVYTAKGPRDRRVRLSAHTAIQFYDVQDRLGYDRPSKAVDWLMNKAKTAIDNLAELPKWDPHETPIEKQSRESYEFQLNSQLGPSFQPQNIDSESIAETMKSFFPTSSETQSMNFQSYPHEIIMSRNTIQNEDLCLSLQSLQDPNAGNTHSTNQEPLFSGSGFESNYQRMVGWNGDTDQESRDRYIYNSISMPQQQSLICHNSAFSQREPLQSSFTQSFHAWDHHGIASTEHQNTDMVHQSSMSGTQFLSQGSSSFQVPARIHGDEQLCLASAKPSSVSPPNSHH